MITTPARGAFKVRSSVKHLFRVNNPLFIGVNLHEIMCNQWYFLLFYLQPSGN